MAHSQGRTGDVEGHLILPAGNMNSFGSTGHEPGLLDFLSFADVTCQPPRCVVILVSSGARIQRRKLRSD